MFPPRPLSDRRKHDIIANYCRDFEAANIDEAGCAVCGRLTVLTDSVPIADVDLDFLQRYTKSVTRAERHDVKESVRPIDGPPIDKMCTIVCKSCTQDVQRKKLPKMSLANGLWLGEVPPILKELTFAERLLIAKVRTNKFAVKVDSGMHKTKCNIIAFENPVPQIYE
ncbi:hypothetical protein SCHPADRAFT_840071, partial [Schizopora paradoxa]